MRTRLLVRRGSWGWYKCVSLNNLCEAPTSEGVRGEGERRRRKAMWLFVFEYHDISQLSDSSECSVFIPVSVHAAVGYAPTDRDPMPAGSPSCWPSIRPL
jgi:hypothetical protein